MAPCWGVEWDTIEAFNAMIEKQKEEPTQAIVSIILLNDQIEVLHNQVKVGNIRPIMGTMHYVRGCTILDKY